MKTNYSDTDITIRPAGPEDAEGHNEAVNESIAQLLPWSKWAHPDYGMDESLRFLSDAREHFMRNEGFSFSVLDRDTGTFLGIVSLNHISRLHQQANIGYWIRTSATGRGVATAATRLCARFGIEEIGLLRIRIQADAENAASIRVAEKAGAHREGTLRKAHVLYDRAHDLALFSIIPGDPGYSQATQGFLLSDEPTPSAPDPAPVPVDELDHSSILEPMTDGIVTLRLVREEDDEALFEAANSSKPEVARFLPWCHEDYCIEETRTWLARAPAAIASGAEYPMAIIETATGRYLGGTGLNGIDTTDKIANLGYWIRTDAAGRGYATRATKLLARFGIERLGLNRVEIIASVENTASLRVAEKAGAVREAILRNRLILHGRSHDVVMHSIVAEDLGT